MDKYWKQGKLVSDKGCPSEGCCGILAAVGGTASGIACTVTTAPRTAVAMLSQRCLTYRAVFQIHRFWQEINSNGCLQRRKALGTASFLPASANQSFLHKLSEMFTNLELSCWSHLPSMQLITTKQPEHLHHCHFISLFQHFSTAQEPLSLHFSLRHSFILTQITSELGPPFLLAYHNSVW